ncbi:MAG: hypothetical protein KJZ57_11465, partial [Anaerolineales bacterium]|nr:hypothetical protein [Anaerolineales bacterium]
VITTKPFHRWRTLIL